MAGIFFLSLYDFIARIFKLSCRFFAWFLKINFNNTFVFPQVMEPQTRKEVTRD